MNGCIHVGLVAGGNLGMNLFGGRVDGTVGGARSRIHPLPPDEVLGGRKVDLDRRGCFFGVGVFFGHSGADCKGKADASRAPLSEGAKINSGLQMVHLLVSEEFFSDKVGEALRACGVSDYKRFSTRITATMPTRGCPTITRSISAG